MITDGIITLFLGIANFFIDLLPAIELEVATQISSSVITYIHMASYFVPLDVIITIFTLQIAIEVVKITIAGVRLFISFIPFM